MYITGFSSRIFAAVTLVALATSARGIDAVLFDPEGDGADPVLVSQFDWAPGNALAVGLIPTSPDGTPHRQLQQAALANLFDPDSNIINVPGLNSRDFEITMVTAYGQSAVSLFPGASTLALDSAQASFYVMYYDDTPDADPLSGTGYDDGIPILSGTVSSNNGQLSLFEPIVPFDQVLPNDYPTISTLTGNGSATVFIGVDTADAAWFPGAVPISQFVYNTFFITPFTQTNPSAQFVDGGVVIPSLGAINGLDGPDYHSQTDATMSPVLAQTTALGDRVWEDLNADGIQDCTDNGDGIIGGPGDNGPECGTGIPGVIVSLLENPDGDADCSTGNEPVIDTTITNEFGFYEFLDLDPAVEYCVRFDQPSAQVQLRCDDAIINPGIGARFSPANQGGDGALDSDADIITGQTGNISLSAGDFDRTWDAGLYCPAKIGNMLVDDRNRNGVQDPGEPGIDEQLVELYECAMGVPGNVVIDSRTTENGGMYMFNPLPPGEYFVKFTRPDGTVFSPKDEGSDDTVDCDTDVNGATECVTLSPNEYNPNVDACVNLPPAGLGDFVFEDKDVDGVQDPGELGIEGVTVNLLRPGDDGECNTPDDIGVVGGTTMTDADGAYLFDNLDPGRYCVEFEITSLPDDFCATDGFPLGAPLFTLHNQGTDDTLDSDADPITGRTGNIDLDADEFDPTNDAGIYCPAKIGDRVWEDTNSDGLQDDTEPGVADVEVKLFECGPDGIAGTGDDVDTGQSRFTDNVDGMYMFGAEPGFELAPGDYYLKFVKPFGSEFTRPDVGGDDTIDSDCFPDGTSACVSLGSRDINLTRDCGLIPPPPPECDLVLDKTCRVETPPEPDFEKCDGKLRQFSVIWTGGDITISGLDNDAPGGVVTTNQEVTFFGPFSDNDVFVDIAGAENGQSKFHMSCSDEDFNSPDDCGKFAGNGKKSGDGFINLWKLAGFVDASDTVLDCAPNTGGDFPDQDNCSFTPQGANCDTLGKPTSLTFRYTGQGCSASNNPQDGKATCDGNVNGLLPVSIVGGKKGLKPDDLYSVTPTMVAPGEEFTISADKFEGDSEIEITNAGGTEENIFHASCSQPLGVGDKYGSLELLGFNGERGGTEVIYGYEVTNNGDPLANVSITDNVLGPVAGPFGLIENQVERFTKAGTISQTTTNVATATGFLADGSECVATDQVTVEVEEPPQPPITCSDIKDITAVSVVWNGSEPVDVTTEPGEVFLNVMPGNQITFQEAGTGNDVELYLSGNTVNGTSKFHVSCSDDDMNGSEDCGSNQGNGKDDDLELINTWLFDGMTGEGGSFACMLPNTGVVEPEDGGSSGGNVTGAASLDLGDDKKVKWELSNNGTQDVFVTRVVVTWPSEHEEVKKFKLEGEFAKDVFDATSPTAVPDEKAFESDANKRKLKDGDSKKLEIEFTEGFKDHTQADYTITVEFDTGQTLSFP